MGKLLLITEAVFIACAILMLKTKTERGSRKELLHSHIFDKSAMSALFLPILYIIYRMYLSVEKFRALPMMLFAFFFCIYMFLLYWDTKAVNRQHKAIVESMERMKKSRKYEEENNIPLKDIDKVKDEKEKDKELISEKVTVEEGLSPEEILRLVREERGENPYAIDGSLIAQQVIRDFRKNEPQGN